MVGEEERGFFLFFFITYFAQHTPYFTGKFPGADFQVEYFATVWHTGTQQLQEK